MNTTMNTGEMIDHLSASQSKPEQARANSKLAVSLCITPNYESHTLIICEFAVSDLHFATVYGLRTDLGGCQIPKFSGGGCPQTPPISFCTLRGSSYKRSMPMLCPSNGDPTVAHSTICHCLLLHERNKPNLMTYKYPVDNPYS